MIKILTLLIAIITVTNSFAAVIIDTDFNDETFGGMNTWADWSIDSTGGMGGTPAAKLHSDEAGVAGHVMNKNVASYASNVFWVEFDVRFSTTPIAGLKFLKFFGEPSSSSYNNLSFWITEGSGTQKEVGYYKDATCISRWDGSNGGTCPAPTHVVTGSSISWGTTWHHYKVYMKRADKGVVNGEVKLWYDGSVKAHITGMDSNPASNDSDYMNEIRLGDYTATADPFDMWIDNLYIGTTEKDADPEPILSNGIPSSTLAYGTTQTTLGVTTDDAAICKYDTSSGISYSSMSNTFSSTSGTTHTQTLTGLTNGQSVQYYVKCDNGITSNSSDYLITVAVASAGCEQDASNCTNETECTTYWPSNYWCPGDTPSCSSSLCTNECSETNWWLCINQTDCENTGKYWWAEACRTIANPGDMTGANLISNGNFTEDNALDYWDQFYTSGIALDSAGLNLSDLGTIAQNASMATDGTQYRFVANIISISGEFDQWTYNNSDQAFTSSGTITGLTTLDSGGDSRIFFFAADGAENDLIVNNIALYEYSSATCEEDNTVCATESACTTYWPAYNWCLGSVPQCTLSLCDTPAGSIIQGGSGSINQIGYGGWIQ